MSAQDSYFVFNGIDTRSYGLYVTGVSVYALPAFSYDVQSVDGREGDIIYSHGRHANVDVTYTVQARGSADNGFQGAFETFRRKIAITEGYCQLTDGYNPDVVRYGYVKATTYATQKGVRWRGGEISITFSCKPQMFLLDGMESKLYPLSLVGSCSSTGLATSTTEYRIGPISRSTISMRLIGGSKNISVKVYSTDSYHSTWSNCSQYSVTIPKNGDTVTVSASYSINYIVMAQSDAPDIGDGSYLEVAAGTDFDDPWRYANGNICIINDTGTTWKPVFRVWHNSTYKLSMSVVGVKDGEYDGVLVLESVSSDVTFDIDCETQTVYDIYGNNIASRFKFRENEQEYNAGSYPTLIPGLNVVHINIGDGIITDLDGVAITLQIKTNSWVV